MRLIVTCALERTTVFPVNHQQQLAGAAYGLLNDSDPTMRASFTMRGTRAGQDRDATSCSRFPGCASRSSAVASRATGYG